MSKYFTLFNLIYLRLLKYNLKLKLNNLSSKYDFESSLEIKRNSNVLKENGYLKIENFFSLEECKSIVDNIDVYIKNNPKKIWREKSNNSDLRLFGVEKINKLIDIFNKDKIIYNIGCSYINSPLKCFYTMAGKTSYVETNNLGSGAGWHRDSINPSYKSMLYLTDVETGDGNLQIIENSNKFENIIHCHSLIDQKLLDTRFKNEDIEYLVKKNDLKIQNISGKAGTLVLFDGSYIHRGSPVIKKTRYALTNYFYLNIDFKKLKLPSPMI